jgi:hypothetical protein
MATPRGVLSEAEDLLATTLADCTEFRTLVDEDEQPAVLANIYNDVLPEPAGGTYTLAELQALRPYALLWTSPDNGYRSRADSAGDGNDFVEGGEIILKLERAVTDGESVSQAQSDRDWNDIVGSIIRQMHDLAGLSGYLNIVAIRQLVCGRSEQAMWKNYGHVQTTVLAVEWGFA